MADQSRRKFFKIVAVGAASMPFAASLAMDAEMDKVTAEDPQAVALQYTEDATTNPASAGNKCATCALYTGVEGDEWGPCSIFGNKMVSAQGWCVAFAPKV